MEGANVIFSYTEEAVTAFLPKEIDHHGAKSIREAIDLKFFERLPKLLILDFSSTAFMDSSGIAFILRAQQRMQMMDGSLLVCHVPAQAKRVLDAAGISRLVTIR